MTNLSGKVVWLTGASSGIGEALAYNLAEKGAKIILSSQEETKLQQVKANCPNNPDNYYILPFDLADSASLESVATKALNSFGHIDILLLNGGVSQRALALKTSLEVERKIMEINFFSALALTKYVLPQMIARQSGHIAVVSSLVGKFGTPLRSSYAASKHALHGYFDSLRSELWEQNIKVTLICPGFIKTNVSLNAFTENGDKYNKMDPEQAQGISPTVCAEKIVRAIASNQEEVYIARKEILAVYLKRFFPRVFSQLIRDRQ